MNTNDSEEQRSGLRRIWVRYENFKFSVYIASALALIGAVVPPVAAIAWLVGIVQVYWLWHRFVSTPCPRCKERFMSLLRTELFGSYRPIKCRSCGLGINLREFKSRLGPNEA